MSFSASRLLSIHTPGIDQFVFKSIGHFTHVFFPRLLPAIRQYGWVLSLLCALAVSFFFVPGTASDGARGILLDGRAMFRTCHVFSSFLVAISSGASKCDTKKGQEVGIWASKSHLTAYVSKIVSRSVTCQLRLNICSKGTV